MAVSRILAKDIPASKREIFSRWYHLLVRELYLLKDAKPEAEWIVAKLGGCITADEAERSLELLCRSGFLRRTVKSYQLIDPVLDTDETTLQAVLMRKFHQETLRVWAQNLNELPADQQELGVLNIPIRRSQIPELRRRMRQFQNEIIGWVQEESEADCVVQLGTYLIGFSSDG